MNKIKLLIAFFVASAFFALIVVHAQSIRETQRHKVKGKAIRVQLKDQVEPRQVAPTVSGTKTETRIRGTAPSGHSQQGYRIVTDVLDGFGGASESDNFRISVNSGGQPSPVGVSQTDGHVVKAGFVHASYVMHGDANADGAIGPGDIVYLINYLYRNGPGPCPMEAGDANCDGEVGPGDIVYLLNYLYRGGPPPPC